MTHLVNIGERLLGGVMFHTEMTDLFSFLGLKGFHKWQKNQMCDEVKTLQKFKSHVMQYHHMLLNLDNAARPEPLIASDWYNRSALDITQSDITNILRSTLDRYVQWEEETKRILYAEKAELEWQCDKEYVGCLIKDVEEELAKVEELRQNIQITSFSPIFIQMLQKDYCK